MDRGRGVRDGGGVWTGSELSEAQCGCSLWGEEKACSEMIESWLRVESEKLDLNPVSASYWLCDLGKASVSLILNILSGKQRVSQVPPWRFALKSKQDDTRGDLKVTQ